MHVISSAKDRKAMQSLKERGDMTEFGRAGDKTNSVVLNFFEFVCVLLFLVGFFFFFFVLGGGCFCFCLFVFWVFVFCFFLVFQSHTLGNQ